MALPQWFASADERLSEPPFSLTIRGSRYTHNLLHLFEEGTDGPTQAAPGGYRLPFVRPESISLSTTGDDLGGSLSFTVEEPVAPPLLNFNAAPGGPWWGDGNLADGALVEFGQANVVDPINTGQTRLFTGFIDQITVGVNGGGQGSVAQVSCVSITSILDRIIVRKPVRRNKRGLSMGRFTIRAGTDAQQIADILRLANGKRRVGSRLVFDPTNYSRISTTAGTALPLPLLEVRLGTLRSALEGVVEAAQNMDGQRRMFYVDPATGALVYGLAGESVIEFPFNPVADAPFRIVDTPTDENYAMRRGGTMREVALSLRPTFYYRCDDDLFPITNHTPAFGADLSPSGGGTDPVLGEDGPGTNPAAVESGNFGLKLEEGVTSNLAGRHQSAKIAGTRSLHVWMKGRGHVRVGGADGLGITTAYNGTNWVYAVEINGTVYNSSTVVSSSAYSYLSASYSDSGDTLRLYRSTGGGVSTIKIQTAVADSDALTSEIEIEAVDGAAYFAAVAYFLDSTTPDMGSRNTILKDAGLAKSPSAMTPRSLTLSVDHSGIVKTGVFLTADSAADADSEPDPYVRSYAALKADGAPTSPAFARRTGPAFEGVIEAPLVRAEAAGSRTEPLNALARAYFTVRRKPQQGGRFLIRGAAAPSNEGDGLGTYGDQTTYAADYGFAAGWGDAIGDEFAGPGSQFITGWRPGQYVGISNAALGLSGAYRIEAVTMTFEPGSWIRAYSIDFAHRPADSIARLLVLE